MIDTARLKCCLLCVVALALWPTNTLAAHEHEGAILQGAAATPKKMFAPAGDDYLAELLADRIDIWPAARMPIKVYIGQCDREEHRAVVAAALSKWQSLSGQRVSFKTVDEPKVADMQIRWERDRRKLCDPASSESGESRITCDDRGICYADVIIATNLRDGERLSLEAISWTALHEIGHALGLQGHSSKSADLMAPTQRLSQISMTSQPTQRDLNTLARLYTELAAKRASEATVSHTKQPVDRWRHTKLVNAAVTCMRNSQFEEAIAILQSVIAIDPGYALARENLSVALNNAAIKYESLKRYDEAIEKLEQACRVSPNDKNCRENLATILYTYAIAMKDDNKDKLPFLKRAYEAFKALYGESHQCGKYALREYERLEKQARGVETRETAASI